MRRWGLIAGVLVMAGAASIAAWRVALFTASVATELDRAGALTSIAPRPQSTIVFDRHGKPAFSFFVEQRTSVPLDRVSPHMVQAILSVEDRRFFQHFGIDPVRIVGAAWRNARARDGSSREAAPSPSSSLERRSCRRSATYKRKIREILLAARLEERYSKARILEEYLNTVYFGEGYYGVEAASRGYFGKSAANVSLADAALLAALVSSPSADAPCVSQVRATKRRNLVLALMRNQGRICGADFQAAAVTSVPGESAQEHRRDGERGQRHQRPVLPGGSAAAARSDVRRRPGAARRPSRLLDLRPRDAAAGGTGDRQADRADCRRAQGRTRPAGRPGRDEPDPATSTPSSAGRDFRESSFNRATQARRRRDPPSSRSSTRRRSNAASPRGRSSSTSTRRSTAPKTGCRTAVTNATNTPCAGR